MSGACLEQRLEQRLILTPRLNTQAQRRVISEEDEMPSIKQRFVLTTEGGVLLVLHWGDATHEGVEDEVSYGMVIACPPAYDEKRYVGRVIVYPTRLSFCVPDYIDKLRLVPRGHVMATYAEGGTLPTRVPKKGDRVRVLKHSDKRNIGREGVVTEVRGVRPDEGIELSMKAKRGKHEDFLYVTPSDVEVDDTDFLAQIILR